MSGTIDDPNVLDPRGPGSNAYIDSVADLPAAEYIASPGEELSVGDALKYTHPDFDANVEKWKKYIDTYQANDIYRFIYKHPREHNDSFAMRVKRGYYFNYVASIVDLFVAYIFEAGIVRDPGTNLPDDLSKFYTDCDRSGTMYSLFMQVAATFAIACGHVGILVNMPRIPDGGFKTEAERKASNHRPYLELVKAQDILDWELDAEGKFEWVKIEIYPPTGRTWRRSINTGMRHFAVWTKTSWEIWEYDDNDDQNGKRVDSGDHNLGEVPLVILKNAKHLSHPWFGDSAVRDIVDINIAILNWCSFADEEVANRCLNILVMQRDDTDRPVEVSHNNVIDYAEGADPPSYLTPGETPLKLIWEAVANGRDEIYRLSKLSGSTGLLGVREATSGIAYAFEFNETNQSLGKKAEFLEQAEKDIHRIFGKWLDSVYNGNVTYPREFGVDDFLLELRILTEARITLTSETAIKELETRVTNKMFAKERQELREKIAAEIQKSKGIPDTMIPGGGGIVEPQITEPGGEDDSDDNDDSEIDQKSQPERK